MEFVTLSLLSEFDRVYLVSGLRRSGNHLLLQMLTCSFKHNSVLFVNDIPDAYYDGLNRVDEQYSQFIESGIISKELITISYEKSILKCGTHSSMECLIPREHVDNLEQESSKWVDRKKILIISCEDQEISRLDQIATAFKPRCNKLYKVIIVRDILNCMSSRFAYLCREHEFDNTVPSPKYKILVAKGGFFKTDMDTLKLWESHTKYIANPEYIIFNYNKFICNDEFKAYLCMQLDIELRVEFYKEIPTFAEGSSFTKGLSGVVQSNEPDLAQLLTRFNKTTCKQTIDGIQKNTVNIQFIQLLKYILSNRQLLALLKNEFLMVITPHREHQNNTLFDVHVCDKMAFTINIPELLLLTGGKKRTKIKKNKKIKSRKSSKR